MHVTLILPWAWRILFRGDGILILSEPDSAVIRGRSCHIKYRAVYFRECASLFSRNYRALQQRVLLYQVIFRYSGISMFIIFMASSSPLMISSRLKSDRARKSSSLLFR